MFPDPTQLLTSLDGGVAWINVPVNTYHVTAEKEGVSYPTVRFRVEAADATERGVQLYIASPPDSLEGSNGSGPGQP